MKTLKNLFKRYFLFISWLFRSTYPVVAALTFAVFFIAVGVLLSLLLKIDTSIFVSISFLFCIAHYIIHSKLLSKYITMPCPEDFDSETSRICKKLLILEHSILAVLVEKPILGKGEEYFVTWNEDLNEKLKINFDYSIHLEKFSLNLKMLAIIKLNKESFNPQELYRMIPVENSADKTFSIESLIAGRIISLACIYEEEITRLCETYIIEGSNLKSFDDNICDYFLLEGTRKIFQNIEEIDLNLIALEIPIMEKE